MPQKSIFYYLFFFIQLLFANHLLGQTAASGAAITSNLFEIELDSIRAKLNSGQIENAIERSLLLRQKARQAEKEKIYRQSSSLLFQGYCRAQKYAQAIALSQELLEAAVAAEDGRRQSVYNTNLGIVYFYLDDYERAAEYYLKSLTFVDEEERRGNRTPILYELKAGGFSNLAAVMKNIDPTKAQRYFENAIHIAKKGGNQMQVFTFYFNLGLQHFEMNNLHTATTYLDSALVGHRALGNINGQLKCKNLLAAIAEKKGDNKGALKFYKESYYHLYRDSIGGWTKGNSYSLSNISAVALSIAEIYLKLDSLPQAYQFASQYYEMTKRIGNHPELSKVTRVLSEIEKKRGSTNSSLAYLNEHLLLKDSLDNNDEQRQILIKDQEYQVLLKEKDIAVLKEQALARQRAIWMMISICGLLLFSLLMILNRFALRRSLHKEKSAKQAEVIAVKEQSLAHLALLNHSKTQLIDQLKGDLQTIASNGQQPAQIDKLIHSLETKVNQEKDWEAFQRHFETIHPAFFKALNTINGQLTNLDLKHCAFIKLNLSNSEASRLLGVDPKSVQMARYRLKKKLPLESEDSLKEYIRSM